MADELPRCRCDLPVYGVPYNARDTFDAVYCSERCMPTPPKLTQQMLEEMADKRLRGDRR